MGSFGHHDPHLIATALASDEDDSSRALELLPFALDSGGQIQGSVAIVPSFPPSSAKPLRAVVLQSRQSSLEPTDALKRPAGRSAGGGLWGHVANGAVADYSVYTEMIPSTLNSLGEDGWRYYQYYR